jgi:hypothetical protein
MQAIAENGDVLVFWKAAVAALNMVNNVFNFFLSGLSETLEESHSVFGFYIFLLLNAKLNDKVWKISNIIAEDLKFFSRDEHKLVTTRRYTKGQGTTLYTVERETVKLCYQKKSLFRLPLLCSFLYYF